MHACSTDKKWTEIDSKGEAIYLTKIDKQGEVIDLTMCK